MRLETERNLVYRVLLAQEVLDDLLLGLFLGETQGHELDNLLAGNLADGSLVHKLSVLGVGLDARNSADLGLAHENGVALHVTAAIGSADDQRVEDLLRVVLGN